MRSCYHIQEVIVSSFDGMMRMDWQDFITEYLVRELGVVHVVAGHDFHFGYMGKGNPQRLQEMCAQLGVGCDIIGKIEREGSPSPPPISAPWSPRGDGPGGGVSGPPPCAHQPGDPRKKDRQLLFGLSHREPPGPAPGHRPRLRGIRHRVWVEGRSYIAVTNVGVRPTVEDNDGRVTVEGFILDFDGDLYGKELRMEFYHRIRGEQKFPSLQELSQEIRRNAEETRAYFLAASQDAPGAR